ncbi:MAG: hypothetical protein ACU83N_16895 [Gammaproteobacteria bacterium]
MKNQASYDAGIKKHRLNKSLLISPLMFLLLFFGTQSYSYAIERSCKAAYVVIDLASGDDKYFGGNNKGSKPEDHFFTATGKCGETVPNRCRERARLKASSCMDAHWAKRWDRVRPGECRIKEPDAWINDDYAVKDIKLHLERRVCEKWNIQSKEGKVPFKVIRKTWGDNGCADSKVLSEGYKIDATMCQEALSR